MIVVSLYPAVGFCVSWGVSMPGHLTIIQGSGPLPVNIPYKYMCQDLRTPY